MNPLDVTQPMAPADGADAPTVVTHPASPRGGEPAAAASPSRSTGFFARIPLGFWLVAALAAVLHIAPFWRAQLGARDGWTFVENLSISPDYMQYRVWERQSQREGPIITNRFTTEPNRAHLPVFFYWGVGKVAGWIDATPERVYAYAGSLFAVVLALLIFATIRHFLPVPHQTWWVFAAIFFGGGLGAHLKILAEIPALRDDGLFSRAVVEPLRAWPVFEDYRSHYVVKTLIDTHFLLIWIVALGAVVSFYFAIARPSVGRWLLCAALFVAITLLHVYEGVTLIVVAGTVALCCWGLPERRRAAVGLFALCTALVGICYTVLGLLYRRSGLPFPEWNAISILFSTLVIAFPIAWVLIAWGIRDYWLRAGLEERFLVGWALGCTIVTLSGPFFPYPDRGTLTMPVPLYIVAGGIFFSRFARVSTRQAVLAAALLGATPLWLAARTWRYTGFRTDAPFQYVNPSHRRTMAALAARADTSDVMLAEPQDLLWLAPEFPGRLYVGHFFLTVNFAEKVDALRAAIAEPSRMPALLDQSGARFLFINASHEPSRFRGVDGLTPLATEDVGWLFERATSGPSPASGPAGTNATR